MVASAVKFSGLTGGVRWVRADLSAVGETGTPGVAVECADIRKNTGAKNGREKPFRKVKKRMKNFLT